MAGHSQFKNIMHRKGAQDAKRAKLFAKLAREITVAAKSGMPDPKQNPRLRNAMINARNENMPNDRINKAKKISSKIKNIQVLYIDDVIKSSKSIKVIQYILKKKKPKAAAVKSLAKCNARLEKLSKEFLKK